MWTLWGKHLLLSKSTLVRYQSGRSIFKSYSPTLLYGTNRECHSPMAHSPMYPFGPIGDQLTHSRPKKLPLLVYGPFKSDKVLKGPYKSAVHEYPAAPLGERSGERLLKLFTGSPMDPLAQPVVYVPNGVHRRSAVGEWTCR